MNLRIARKTLKAVGTPDAKRYTDFQIGKASERYEKTRTAKEANRYWYWLMRKIGPEGRADLVASPDRATATLDEAIAETDAMLPELTDEDRAAIDALGDDFIDRLIEETRVPTALLGDRP